MADEIIIPELDAQIVQKQTGQAVNPAVVYIASLGSKKSQRGQRNALARILRIIQAPVSIDEFPWQKLSYEHIQLIRSRLEQAYAPSTANLSLSALRMVLRMAWRMNMMDTDTFQRLSDVQMVKGKREPAGRHISVAEVKALFEACASFEDPWIQHRNAAMLSLLFGVGMRRAEAASLEVDQLDLETGAVRFIGKGNKERITYLPLGAKEALRIWVTKYRPMVRASRRRIAKGDAKLVQQCKKVLLSAKHGRYYAGMSEGGILHALNALAKRSGTKQFSPHDMRRTFIGEMLDSGVDISTIQQMVGHASPRTTSRYDRRGDRVKQQAAGKLHVPYVPEGEDDSG